MTNKLSVLGLFTLFFLCNGCQQADYSYDDLMQHPAILQKAVIECQVDDVSTGYCQRVKQAERDFSLLVIKQQNNPEEFGERILHAQQQLVLLHQTWLKEQSHSAKVAYEAQLNQVRTLLAVIAG